MSRPLSPRRKRIVRLAALPLLGLAPGSAVAQAQQAVSLDELSVTSPSPIPAGAPRGGVGWIG
ncbi:hypothetical protein, partial [Klebsiella pneumoniae]|uniref:hypothetical protein n=1 Tax=Klebsiella pneumoniae TaxID=573 RepID=UPI0013D299AF